MVFFFFKQKTAYEMRISDWSSDVCSSDLDALKNQIAMLNDETEVYNAAAYYVGVNKCTEDSKEAQKILDVLEAQKPFVATYNSDGTIDRLAAGEVLAQDRKSTRLNSSH